MPRVAAAPTPVPPRRSQAERRAATQAALLDATVECLVERGYPGTTTALICARAGLSRTAHLHHYGSRAALLAAGVAHLARRQIGMLEARVDALPRGTRRPAKALDLIWDAFTTPLFRTAVELAAAARTDAELRAELLPVERAMDRDVMTLCQRLFPEQAGRRDFDRLMDLVLSTIRGLAIRDLSDPGAANDPRRWTYARTRLLRALEEG